MNVERQHDPSVVLASRVEVGQVFEDRNGRIYMRISVPKNVTHVNPEQQIPVIALADDKERGGIGVLLWLSPGDLVHVHERAKVVVGRAPAWPDAR